MNKSGLKALIILLVLHFIGPTLFALPTGESVETGSATFERPDTSTLNIKASNGTVINFDNFNIAANETVNFTPFDPAFASTTNVLSRVSGAGSSGIYGSLQANLNLFLVNTNGIYFAPSAQVNARNLVASTLDIATNNFVDGNYAFEHKNGDAYSQILNEGRITADNIALVASGVHSNGIIAAKVGTVHLASGDKVTVSFDQRSYINVEINQETSGQVIGLDGKTVKDAVANSGSIEGTEVVMSAKTASDIFVNAVNQTGVVKATGMVQEGGVIRIKSNRNVQVSGTLEAPQGGISVSSDENVAVSSELKTIGNTEVTANKDIHVDASIETSDGNLSLIADADLDGTGAFTQSAGTHITTIHSGDIAIQASGASSLANISSAGDFTLHRGGAEATFSQQPGSSVSTFGSIVISQGVALNANNTVYNVGKNWICPGIFNAEQSTVNLVSEQPALVDAATFNNLVVTVPGKEVSFRAGLTTVVTGALTLNGAYGNLLSLISSEPGIQWDILPLGETNIAYAQFADCHNVRGPPLVALHSTSLGNNSFLNLGPRWTGQGVSANWSDPDNWDTGTTPTIFDTVTFDGITGINSNKDSFLDANFGGSIANLVMDGYLGTTTLGRDITVTGDITLKTGTLIAADHIISVAGNWANLGGDFQAAASTVIFYDASKRSMISGNNTFNNFECITSSKILTFEAGKTTTITGALKLLGSYGQPVKLLSSIEGSQWSIDPQGPRDITYSWVKDSYNLNPVRIMMTEATNQGNCFGWDPTGTWTGAVSNLWSVAGNWTGLGGNEPGIGDALIFPAGAANLSNSNDFVAGMSFSSITITGSGYTLAGNSINLGSGGLTASNFYGATNTVSLNIAFDATRTIAVTNPAATLAINGVISGAAGVGLVKAGNGTLILGGLNTYPGSTAINAGTLNISADANLGTAPAVPTAGSIIFGGGTLQTTATFALNSNRGISLGAGGGTIDVNPATVLTYGGVIDGGNALAKNDTGELVLQGINTNSSTVAVNAGTLTLSGASGTMVSATFTVNQGGTLNIDNSTNGTNNSNRLSDTNALTLNGGEFIYRGTNTPSTDMLGTVGTLTLTSGDSTVTVFSGTGGKTVLTFASVTRSAGATVLFRGTNLGSNPGAGNTNIMFNTSTNLNLTGGGGGVGTKTISIVPYALGDTAAAGAGIGFVTYNIDSNGNANGIRPLTLATEYLANTLTAGNNVRITGATTVGANLAINSLLIDGASLDFNSAVTAYTLTITSGAVARNASGAITRTGAALGAVAFAGVEGKIWSIAAGGAIPFTFGPNITGTAGITKGGVGDVNFNTVLKGYTVTGTTINKGSLTVSILNGIPALPVTVNAAGTLTLNGVNDAISTLTLYSGGTLGATVATGANTLTLGAAGTVTLSLNGSGAVGSTVSGNMALGVTTPFAIADGTASDDLTISAVISGGFGITKQGNGTLTLSGSSSYTGLTTISAGTIKLGAAGGAANTPLGTNGTGTSVTAGAALDLNGFTLGIVEALTLNGTGINSGGALLNSSSNAVSYSGLITLGSTGVSIEANSGNISLTAAGTITGAGFALTLGGSGIGLINSIIGTGAGTLTKVDDGTWTLSGADTYTGTTTVSTGTLKFGVVGGISASSAVTVNGTLDLNGLAPSIGSLAGTGIVTNSAAGAATLTAGALNTSTVFSGIIKNGTGSVAFTKAGTGILTLSGLNSYTGTTTINANGTLKLGAAGDGTNGPLGTTAGITSIVSGGVLDLNGYSLSTAEPLTLNGTGIGATGALINSSATAVTFSGQIILGSASSIKANAGAINLTAAGTMTGATFGLTLGGTGNGTLASIIGTTSGTLTKQDAGTWTLSGNSTFTGATTISAGTLKIGATGDGTYSPLGTVAGITTVAAGAVLDLNGIFMQTAEPLTLNGTGILNAGALINSSATAATFPGLITLGSTGVRIEANAGDINLTAAGTTTGATFGLILGGAGNGTINSIIGTTSGTLTKIDNGTWTLGGVNTYTGTTKVVDGTLKCGVAGAISASSAVTVNGTFDLNGVSPTIGSLEGNGSITNNAGGSVTLTAGALNTSTIFSGIIQNGSGTVSFSKAGTGTLTLTGNSTFTGTTTIGAGTLKLGAAGDNTNGPLGTTAGITSITSGATLDLNGITLSTAEPLTLNGTGVGANGALINSSVTAVTFSGQIILGSASSIKANAGAINLTAAGTMTGATFGLTLGGTGTGSLASVIGTTTGTLTKQDAGTWTVSGLSTYTGLTTISAGILKVGVSDDGTNSALGTAGTGTTVTAGAVLDLNGFNVNIAEALTLNGTGISGSGALMNSSGNTSSFGGLITLGSTGVSIEANFGNINLTNTNTITGATFALTLGGTGNGTLASIIGTTSGAITKVDSGTWTLTGASTNTSAASAVNGGTLIFSGANGSLTGATSALTVNQGGTLILDNTSNNNINRLPTNALTLNGGEFVFKGSNVAATNASETIGALTLSGGDCTVTVVSGTGGSTVLTFASLSRSNGATVLFRGTNLGSNPLAGNTNIMFTASAGLSLTGGVGGVGTTTIKIVPFAIGDTAAAGPGIGFVTYNIDANSNSNGIRPLALVTEYISNNLANGTNNVRITGATNVAATASINSLLLDGNSVDFNSNVTAYTLTITSGAVARNASGAITRTGSAAGALALGAEGNVWSIAAGGAIAFTIGPNITGTLLNKAGVGDVTFNTVVKSYTSTTTINKGSITVGLANAIPATALVVYAGGTLTLSGVNDAITTLTLYNGGTSGATIATGAGILTLGVAGTVTLNLSGSGAAGSTISGNVTLGATTTFTIADGLIADDLTVSAIISGAGLGITKAGAGTLTLTGANSYTGAVTISAGTLSVNTVANSGAGNASSLGTGAGTPGISMAGAGTLKYTGTGHSTNRAITLSSTGATIDASGAGALTLTGGVTGATYNLILTGTGTGIFTTAAIGTTSGTLTKNGTGTWTLSFANTYTGATTVNTGTLAVTVDAALGTNAAGTTVNNGAKLDLQNATYSTTAEGLTLAAGSTLLVSTGTSTYLGGITLTGASTILVNGTQVTFSGGLATGGFILTVDGSGTTIFQTVAISGTGGITKNGNGTLTLNFANTYSGITTINAGTVAVTATGALGTAVGTFVNAGTLDFRNVAYATAEVVTLGTGSTLAVSTGTSSFNGPITLADASTILVNGTQLTLSGGLNNVDFLLTVDGSGATIFTTLPIVGDGGLTKSGAGTLTLGVANAYSGDTTIGAGILKINIANAIPEGSGAGNVIVNGTLEMNGINATINGLSGNGIVDNNSASAVTLTIGDNNATGVFSGAIQDTVGNVALVKIGSGALTLSGNNTFVGGVTLNQGTLNINSNTAIGTGTLTINAGTIDNTSLSPVSMTNNNLQVWNGSFIFTGGSNLIMGSGAVTMNANCQVTVGGSTFGVGPISGAAYNLTKAGAGTLTLAGAMTVTNLTISAGTLDVGAANNSITLSGDWTNQGTFNSGTGLVTFNGGWATIDAGGLTAPKDFYDVVISTTGTKTLASGMLITHTLQVNTGTLAGDYDVTVQGGFVTSSTDGIINMTGGTFTVQGTGNFGGSTSDWTFSNLSFGDGITTATTTKLGSNSITVGDTLTVNLNHTLLAGSSTWNLLWKTYLMSISMIASGYDHTIALTADGYVFGWGSNAFGQLGDGTNNDGLSPVEVLSGEQGGGTYLQNITKIAAGGYHSVAIGLDGFVYTWGYNGNGQLGNNTTVNSSTPIKVHGVGNSGNLSGISQIGAGGFETAAVSSGTGYVYCWGYNGEGELGNNSTSDSYVPVQVHGVLDSGYLSGISTVSVGGSFALALDSGGSVYAWGFNGDGELGNGNTTDSHVPVQVLRGAQAGVTYLHNITQISAGDSHGVALDSTGFVYTWGYNSEGELGNNSTTSSSSPVQVLSGVQGGGTYLKNVTVISAGAAHTLAIADNGYVYSWGEDTFGQLGNNSNTNSLTPVKILSGDQAGEAYLHSIFQIAAGGAQTVTLSLRNVVFNCGNNADGQLGNGTTVGAARQIRVQAGAQGPTIHTPLVVNGTLNSQTSTFNISDLYHLTVYIAPVMYNNLTISNSSQANYWLNGDITLTGNLIISNSTLNSNNHNITIAGNWTNSGGTFNPGTGTVTFNSATQTQYVASGGSTFHTITVTNSTAGGLAFMDRLITDNLNAASGVKKISFASASLALPNTITTSFNVNGSTGNKIELAPLVAYATWYLDAPITSLHDLIISYSHQANGKTLTATTSTNSGFNTNWTITP